MGVSGGNPGIKSLFVLDAPSASLRIALFVDFFIMKSSLRVALLQLSSRTLPVLHRYQYRKIEIL